MLKKTIAEGVDWVMLGRAAILQHNFPKLYEADSRFSPIEAPVSIEYLRNEGLSEKFIQYVKNWRIVSESIKK